MYAFLQIVEFESLPVSLLYGRQIRAVDESIDNIVDELYGLSEEEIKIVEGAK